MMCGAIRSMSPSRVYPALLYGAPIQVHPLLVTPYRHVASPSYCAAPYRHVASPSSCAVPYRHVAALVHVAMLRVQVAALLHIAMLRVQVPALPHFAKLRVQDGWVFAVPRFSDVCFEASLLRIRLFLANP